MDLAIDLTRTSGRARRPISGEIVRELTAADLALLDTERGIKPNAIKKLRDSHHSLARLVATGLSGAEISVATGYSQSRISILKSDPAFADLVSFYRDNLEKMKDQVETDCYVKLVATRNDVLEEIHDRVLDTPEQISLDQLFDMAKGLLDRTGYGPQSKSTNLNLNLDIADRVAAGRRRADQHSAAVEVPPMQPGAPVRRSLPAPNGQGDKHD